ALFEVARGAADTAIVDSQHGESAASQIVGEHEERLVTHQRLVAILTPRSGDQEHRRKRTVRTGPRQRAGEPNAVGRILIRDFLGHVGKRRRGFLGSSCWLNLLSAPQYERKVKIGRAAGRERGGIT